jgi:hypothetical protein
MALRGNLRELSLPDIFQLVTFSRKTGVLRIQQENGAQGSVWFREGDVFFAQSNWRTELLGERLVRAQRITPMALDRALELRAEEPEGGLRLGQILVREGYITDKVLEAFVQEQMQDTIFDLMRWDEGDFEFEAMPEAPEEDIGLTVSIENVIMEGSRRLDEWNRIKKKIPSTDIVFKMATAPGEGTFEISLKPIEWNLLLLVDGTRSVAELAVQTNRTDFEVARIVYGLFSAGLLEFASDEEAAVSRAEREEREARLAKIEAQRAVEKPKPSAPAKPAAPVVAAEIAETETKTEARTEAAPEAGAGTESERSAPVEVPGFLDAELPSASPDDMAMFEAAMGAVLEAPTPEVVPAPAEKAQPYVPGEEPAFIAASQDVGVADGEPVPSVEELLADITQLTPAAEQAQTAPVAPEFELVTELQPEPELEPEIGAEEFLEPEPELEAAEPSAPEIAPEPEMAPEFEAEPALETAAEPTPESAPEPIAEFGPDLLSVVSSLEEPVPAEEEGPVSEPGTYVVVPQPLPEQVTAGLSEAEELPAAEPVAEPAFAQGAESVALELETEVAQAPEQLGHTETAEPQTVEAAPEPPTLAPEPSATAAPEGLQDFENDLMALGLGELPAELRISEAPETHRAEEFELEPVVEPMGVGSTPPGEGADFSALLESLDISADDAQAGVSTPADTSESELSVDALLGTTEAEPAGVISTDAFLDDLSLEDGLGFSGELSDELSALTGADRHARPSASVHHLPAEGEALLHRDARVDRETMLKIIDGIKNL